MAHSIVIDLLLKTGSFETDTDRGRKALAKFEKQVEATAKRLAIGLVAGATAGLYAFDKLVKSVAEFKGLEEQIGASAEAVASLATAAKISDTPMRSIADATLVLTRNLQGVDDESKAAGAALKALGIPIDQFRRLDPAAQMDAVSKAMAGFADGSSRSAVAMALFGRSGAQILPFLKDLEETGGRQVRLTQQQIELADEYAKAQSRAQARLQLFAQVAAVQALPAVSALTAAAGDFIGRLTGVERESGELATKNTVATWAERAVRAVGFVIDAADGVVRLFQATGLAIGGMLAATDQALQGNFRASVAAAGEAVNDIKAIFDQPLFSQDLERRLAEARAKAATAGGAATGPGKPQINFDGAVRAPKAAASEADRLLKSYTEGLERQLQATKNLTVYETVLADIRTGKLAGANAGQQQLLLNLAVEIDAVHRLAEARAEADRQLTDMNRRVEENASAARQLVISVETPLERMNRRLAELNELAASNPFIAGDAQLTARLRTQIWDEWVASIDKTQSRLDDFGKQFAERSQDLFGDALYNTWKGSTDNVLKLWGDMLLRMLAQAQAADLSRALFGSDGKGNLSGGWINALGSAISNWMSGGSTTSTEHYRSPVYGYAMADGTNYVPYDGFKATLHEGEAVVPKKYNHAAGAPGGGGARVEVNVIGAPAGVQSQSSRRGADGRTIVDVVLRAVADDAMAGGITARGTAGRFGLNNGAALSRRRG